MNTMRILPNKRRVAIGRVLRGLLPFAGVCFAFCPEVFAQQPGYVVITTTNITSQSGELDNFVAHKHAMGFDVQVVSNTVAGWGTNCGDAAAEDIRNWLKSHYTNTSGETVIHYVLLVGNPNPTNGDVPMKACYPQGTNTEDMVPSDCYYGDLTGNWDANSNSYCGEWSDYDSNNVPTAYEVVVGRIPNYGAVGKVDSILAKIIAYETSTNTLWRREALIPMSQYGYIYPTIRLQGEWIVNNVLIPEGWPYHRIYDDGVAETMPCSTANVLAVWTNSHPGVVIWASHGVETGTHPVGDPPDRIVGLAEIPALDDNYPAFVFQGSCRNAHPQTTNNLAYSILLHGGLATVAATWDTVSLCESWAGIPVGDVFPEDQPDYHPGFVIYWSRNLVLERLPTGDALFKHRADISPRAAAAWQTYLVFTVYGCPASSPYPVPFTGPVWFF